LARRVWALDQPCLSGKYRLPCLATTYTILE
jgi:hypothetical protein